MTLWDQIGAIQRDAIVADLINALARSWIPVHLHDGLVRYFADGTMPGGFLQAVLANNLTQAIGRGDPESLAGLVPLVRLLVAVAPSDAWGSSAAVLAWSTTPERFEIRSFPAGEIRP